MTEKEREERLCNCGAGHGSHEGHVAWCNWVEFLKRRGRTSADTSDALKALPSKS
jgi:hypothetical protein